VARRAVTSFLLSALAGALGALLGLVRPLADVPCPDPPPVPLLSVPSPFVPRLSFGLRGSYSKPQTGGEP
jgi:hypothetical protein